MKLFVTIFALTGIGMLIGGGIAARDTMQLREVAKPVPGKVVSVESSTSDGSTTYAPVYEFEVDGEKRRHTATVSSSSYPEIGSTQTLLVDPNDPSEVKPDSFMGQWFIATLLGGMGILFTGIALVVGIVLASVRRRANAAMTMFGESSTASTPTASESTHDEDHTDHDPFVGSDAPSSQKGPFV